MTAKPIIPWPGGKRRLAKKILPLYPEHRCYVEVFCGAGALFFMKQQSKAEVINDVNGDLMNLYRVIKHHLKPFIEEFEYDLVGRAEYLRQKKVEPTTLTDIQRAARFYYLQKLAFGGKVEGQTYGTSTTSPPRLNIFNIQQDVQQAYVRLARVNIEQLDWKKCIEKYDRSHTFFMLDPPYLETMGYGVEFGEAEYQLMADFMRSTQGKMLITLNNHPKILELFKGFSIKTVDIKYTVGGAKNAKQAKEVIIRNY